MHLLVAAVLISIVSFANAFTRNDFPPNFLFGAGTSAYQPTLEMVHLQKRVVRFNDTLSYFPLAASQQTRRNSSLDDWSRVKYMHEYIGGVLDMLRSGLNIRGYFVWAFLDVFELLNGLEGDY
ncbi:hypothetical protein RYX36_011888 [Vicia faba]